MSDQFVQLWPLVYESPQVLRDLQADRAKVGKLMAAEGEEGM